MLSAIFFLYFYLWQAFLETHSFQNATNVFVCYGFQVKQLILRSDILSILISIREFLSQTDFINKPLDAMYM